MVAQSGPQKSIIEILKSGKRVRSAEIIPPRNGTETDVVLRQIEKLKTVPTDFISVTKGAGGSLRGGTLPIAQMIKSRFEICSLAHFTCRDFTIEEIENSLMDHYYFGVSNILALRGDPPDGQPDYFKPAPNRHSFAWQLVEQIRALNQGDYLFREGFDKPVAGQTVRTRKGTPTNFCIGVAAHPEHGPQEDGIRFLARKVEAGAEFAITQMLFSAEPYDRFVESCAKHGVTIPIIPGLRILTQAASAERMTQKFGASVPRGYIARLEKARSKEDGRKIGLELTYELCQRLFKAGAPGAHVFVMSDEATATELLLSLA